MGVYWLLAGLEVALGATLIVTSSQDGLVGSWLGSAWALKSSVIVILDALRIVIVILDALRICTSV